MPISGQGWELLVSRQGLQRNDGKARTYGSYQVHLNGAPVAGLSGNICESIGPGDNSHADNGKRIEQGQYPLWTQFGRYRSIGYADEAAGAGAEPMPGVRLEGTGARTAILIHPGHPPTLYLSSVGCLNPTNPLTADENMNFWDSRGRVIAIIDSLRQFAPTAFAHEVVTRIPGAFVVIDGEPTDAVATPPPAAATTPEPASLPISKTAAIECAQWLLDNFGAALRTAVQGKPYHVSHLCGIVCQETAYKWLKWKADNDAQRIVQRCVFDASGDYPGTSRSAFPPNTAAFRSKYGDTFTDMLIEEANVTRRLQGWTDQPWVYKGYGIFQYDLQSVDIDRAFFEQKQWYDFQQCLDRACRELDSKLQSSRGDLWLAIQRYNGSGSAAVQYAENVKVFTGYCSSVTGD
jgi:hypothetical protein